MNIRNPQNIRINITAIGGLEDTEDSRGMAKGARKEGVSRERGTPALPVTDTRGSAGIVVKWDTSPRNVARGTSMRSERIRGIKGARPAGSSGDSDRGLGCVRSGG